jgi:hypothetical protein
MSGRTLRRLPVLAHARHMAITAANSKPSEVEVWLAAMERVVAEQNDGRDKLAEL